MELHDAWKKLEAEKLSKPLDARFDFKKTSKHPVNKLIRNFKITLGFSVLFELMFIYLLFVFTQPLVQFFTGIMIIVYVFFIVVNYKVLKNLERTSQMDGDLKGTLHQIYDNVNASLKFQRKAALIIYPFAVTAGFLMGLSEEKDAVEMMQKSSVIISLLIAIVVLTPLSYLLAVWMEKVSYGKCLKQLQELIKEFDKEESENPDIAG
ncbi:MAG TPA: hypothetical protein PKC24_03730 [Cyclobacteriaceae bacterium]|nr:hypothetical protein [Cyclobacteriaceae bacterium]